MYRKKFTPGRKSQDINKIIGIGLLQSDQMYTCFCGQQDKWNPLQNGYVNPMISANMRVAQILGSTRISGRVKNTQNISSTIILPLRNKF